MLQKVSPKSMIEQLVRNEYRDDHYFTEVVLNIIFNGNPNRVRVRCTVWSYDWGIDFFYSPVLYALDTVSYWYFNAMTLPSEMGPLRDNLIQYIKGVKTLLITGLYKYACKDPPIVIETHTFDINELFEYSLLILDKNL